MSDVERPDITFLTSFREIWTFLTTWTITTVGIVYFLAGIRASQVNAWKCSLSRPTLLFPLIFCMFGLVAGFIHGAPMASLIAGLYRSIPYSLGVDIATGLGISQAVVILYIHMGGAVFIHYYACNVRDDQDDDEDILVLEDDYRRLLIDTQVDANGRVEKQVDQDKNRLRIDHFRHKTKVYATEHIQLFDHHYKR